MHLSTSQILVSPKADVFVVDTYKNMHVLQLIFKGRNVRGMTYVFKENCMYVPWQRENLIRKEMGSDSQGSLRPIPKIACATQQRLHLSPELHFKKECGCCL